MSSTLQSTKEIPRSATGFPIIQRLQGVLSNSDITPLIKDIKVPAIYIQSTEVGFDCTKSLLGTNIFFPICKTYHFKIRHLQSSLLLFCSNKDRLFERLKLEHFAEEGEKPSIEVVDSPRKCLASCKTQREEIEHGKAKAVHISWLKAGHEILQVNDGIHLWCLLASFHYLSK